MSKTYERQLEILKAIIQKYHTDFIPVSSRALEFDVSSATIRNDMIELEEQWLIIKPHTSAGRMPTVEGYRLFINNFVEEDTLIVRSGDENITLDEDRIYNCIANLAKQSNAISFAVLNTGLSYYLGVSNLLEQKEFTENLHNTSELIALLEKRHEFAQIMQNVDIPQNQIRIFVGLERVLPVHINCSMIVAHFQTPSVSGLMGILGSIHMDYMHNAFYLKQVLEGLQENENHEQFLLNPGKEEI